jgi:hypothetical protein
MVTGEAELTAGSARLGNEDLLDAVAAVAKLADPKRPVSVSQTQFDRARTHPDAPACPLARGVYQRVNRKRLADRKIPWPRILEEACADGSKSKERVLSAWQRDQPLEQLNERIVNYALRRVAMELKADTINRREYDQKRSSLIRAEKRRRDDGTSPLERLLPTADQISWWAMRDKREGATSEDLPGPLKFGAWNKALVGAGLEPVKEKGNPKLKPAAKAGLSLAEAVCHFVEHNPWLPSETDLRVFANKAGPVAMATKTQPWDTILAEAITMLETNGAAVPGRWRAEKKRLGLKSKPEIAAPEAGIPGAITQQEQRSATKTVTPELIVEGVRHFIRHQRRTSGPISRTRYQQWRVGTDWPSASHFEWNPTKAEALRLEREAAAAIPF